MHKPLLFTFFMLAFSFLSPVQVFAAANVAESACSNLGSTLMDDNKQNVVACLYNNSHQLKWKAVGGINVSCSTGKAITSVVDGVPKCGTAVPNITCGAGQAVVGFKNGVPQCGAFGSTEITCGYAKTHYIGIYPNYKCFVDEDTYCNGKSIIGKCTSSADCPGYANWTMDTDCGGPSVCPTGFSVKVIRETIDQYWPAYVTAWFTCSNKK
ncbi:MAG: hypothetical protein WC464_00845 [Bdellovibrionales bacterium]